MSEGGKLALMKAQARQVVATAPSRAIGEAARQEIEPVMARLDLMTRSLEALPEQFRDSAEMSAESLRASLSPMVDQVASFRASLAGLPALMAQQMDGVVAQVQAEGLSMRTEIAVLRSSLKSLPDALARQVEPILAMAETLDGVLVLQRSSLEALHERTMATYRAALDPTTERVETAIGAITQQAARTETALRGMEALPQEIRTATAEARTAGDQVVARIRQARSGQWHPVLQLLATTLLATLIVGGMVAWLGTHGSSGLRQLAGQSAREKAWDSLYEANPSLRPAMDQYLAASPPR